MFSWNVEDCAISQSFRLRIKGELFFRQGCITIITGPTASGKTSLLNALMGEMHFLPDSDKSWFNLPRHEGVAYATQESWVQNDTIKVRRSQSFRCQEH